MIRQLPEKAATQKPRPKPLLIGRRTMGDKLKTLKEFEDRLRKASKPSRWQISNTLITTRQDLLQLTQLQRHALTQSPGAIKHPGQQAKSRHQHLLRENQRLSDQPATVIGLLPPVS